MAICGLSNIANVGMTTLGYIHSNYGINAIEDIFLSHYGICVTVCFEIWYKLSVSGKLLSCQTLKHLFWTLAHMKTYCTIRVMCTLVKTTLKTFLKHVHHITELISEFNMVSKFKRVKYNFITLL